jgi:hypothetical protein
VFVLFLILLVPRLYAIILYKSTRPSGLISFLYLWLTRSVSSRKIYEVYILVLFGIVTSL